MSVGALLEEFAQGDSSIHRTDPRVKVISVFAFACVVAAGDSYLMLLVALVFASCLVWLARLDTQGASRRLFLVNGFIGVLWLFLPFTQPGQPWFSLGPLTATHDGIRLALRITLRANAIMLAMLALLGTTPVFHLIHALRHLHMPTKLVHLFFFCCRYISVIEQEYHRLRAAMKVRCFRPSTSMHTYKTYAYLVGMLLVRSYERSQRVYQAMLCRGFQGEYPIYRHFRMRWQDWSYLTVQTLVVAGLIVLGKVT